jgi:ferric-dicitrate binding protein FerR (iron transport regulator)
MFEETPLVDVAEEFNRYSARKLVIADAELRSMGVSGVYSPINTSTTRRSRSCR